MSGTELHNLLAREAITQVLHRYCRAMDRIDAELGYSVWHVDGDCDYGEQVYQGSGRGFIDWVCAYHRTLDRQFHQVGNVTIDVDGDRAASETYITVALLLTEEARKKLTTGRGRYLDRWSRRDGVWAIDHRDYVLDFAITQDVEGVWEGWGTRNLSDQSYQVLGAPGRA